MRYSDLRLPARREAGCLTRRIWLPALCAALVTGVGTASRPALADESALQMQGRRFTEQDLPVPWVSEDADTLVLPLTAEPYDLSDWRPSDLQTPIGGGQKPITVGRFQVFQVRTFHGSLNSLSFHAEGDPTQVDPKLRDVLIVYTDPKTNKLTTLSAQTVDYDDQTRKVTAVGYGKVLANGMVEHPITLKREDGTFTGNRIEYDFDDRIGLVEQALVQSEFFRLSGEKIQANKDGTFTVTRGHFTTCNKHKPDYEVAAAHLTVYPNHYVSARNITLYLGGVKLLPVPSYRRNLQSSSQVAGLIKPGYNSKDGLTLQTADTPIQQTHTTFDYAASLNFRRWPTGFLLYQHDLSPTPSDALPPRGVLPTLGDPLRGILETIAPPTYRDYAEVRTLEPYPRRFTVYSILSNEQFIFNRRRNDLSLSRFPEFGFRYANVFGHLPPASVSPIPVETSLLERVPNAPFLLDIYGSAGVLREQPTNITAGRFASRINLASQPAPIGRRLSFRAGISDWFNVYTQGSLYNIVSPEAEVDYIPTSTSVFNIAYRYLDDNGTTPFVSDMRDIRHELRLQYQVGGPITFGVVGKYDIERSRPYDAEIAVVRNLDCMQFGVAYRFRSSQFNLIFNLIPPGRN